MSTQEDIKEAVWQAMEDGFEEEEILEAVQEAFDQGNPYEEVTNVIRKMNPPRKSELHLVCTIPDCGCDGTWHS